MNIDNKAQTLDGNGAALHEGDKVYCYDFDINLVPSKFYGILCRNTEFPHVSAWYIVYEDGAECAVLDISQVFKV